MKSLISKRLPGILAAGLVALAVGAAGAPASAAPVAGASGLTSSQSKQKKKELKKCNKKKNKKQKKKCKDKVNDKYKKISQQNSAPKGETKLVKLGDNYYVPNAVDLKVNDSIKWSWADIGGFEPHNVTLDTGPSGVSRNDFVSQTSAVTSYTFKRTFTKPGDYKFVCTLHFGMEMNVKVSK